MEVLSQIQELASPIWQTPEEFCAPNAERKQQLLQTTKLLYDYVNSCTTVPQTVLPQLCVDGFDSESIWAQLALQNEPASETITSQIEELSLSDKEKKNKAAKKKEEEEEEEQEEEDDEEGLEGAEEDEDEDMMNEDDLAEMEGLEEEGEGEEEEEEEDGEEEEQDEEEEETTSSKKKSSKSKKTAEEEEEEEEEGEGEEEEEEEEGEEGEKPEDDGSGVKAEQFFSMDDMDKFADQMEELEEKERDEGEKHDQEEDEEEEEEEDLTDEEGEGKAKYTDFFAGSKKGKKKKGGEEDEDEEEGLDMDDDEADDGFAQFGQGFAEEGGSEDELDGKLRAALARAQAEGEEEEEGEEEGEEGTMTSKQAKSSFEKQQEALSARIAALEEKQIAGKPWELTGEASARDRPKDSLLETHLEHESGALMPAVTTEESTAELEAVIKQRIVDQAWDDVERKQEPVEEKKRRTLVEVSQEKSKLGLGELYEQEFLEKAKQMQPGDEDEEKEKEIPKEHKEISALMSSLFYKLDALSNFQFTPKPPKQEIVIRPSVASIAMEEVIPMAVSKDQSKAPEEVMEKPTDKEASSKKKRKMKHKFDKKEDKKPAYGYNKSQHKPAQKKPKT